MDTGAGINSELDCSDPEREIRLRIQKALMRPQSDLTRSYFRKLTEADYVFLEAIGILPVAEDTRFM